MRVGARRRHIVISLATAAFAATAQIAAAESQVICGDARFTAVTPNLIRIESGQNGAFLDAPTLFAVGRDARFEGAKVTRSADGGATIDTGAITLTYKPDGKPLGPTNLSATIRRGDKTTEWRPGQADPLNLGGTMRTLDQVRGPSDLGQGLLSRSGWAVVDDTKSPIVDGGQPAARPASEKADWYLFGYGDDYRAAMRSLAAIGGPVPLPRKNLLGLWYSRYWAYSADDFRAIVKEYADHGFPLDNIVMDMDWHLIEVPGSNNHMIWTGYTVNEKLLPDIGSLLKWFHGQGLSVTLNDHPADGVQPHERMYADFMRAMGADPATKRTIPFDAADPHYMDIFWRFTHAPLEKLGVDFWWLDWQQDEFTRTVPGLTNLAALNRHYFEKSSADGRRGASFSRWAGWGDHRHPIHFSGDADTGWPMLAFEVPFTATSGNVGCFFWTHDIGGHMGGRNEESYARWCQFGALSASLRSHSSRSAELDRRPWTYPDWAERSMRASFQLRSVLMPYIYTSVAESCAQTVPLLRPPYFDHPNDDAAYRNAQQYTFGDHLLVAPIATPGVGPSKLAWQSVWFAKDDRGAWYDWFTGERHEADGGASIVASDIDTFPLFARGGVPIPMQPYTPRPTTAAIDTLVVRCYPGQPGRTGTFTLYEDDGQTQAYKSGASATTLLSYARAGETLTLSVAPTQGTFAGLPAQRGYTFELPCVERPTRATLDGADATVDYDEATSTARITVPARPVGKATTLVVEAKDRAPAELRRRAVAARLAGVLGHPVEGKTADALLAAGLAGTNDAQLRAAVLASVGVAVVKSNDSPTLYHGHESYRLAGPAGAIDANSATVSMLSANAPNRETQTAPLAAGAAIEPATLTELAKSLPEEDAVLVANNRPTLRVRFTTHGRPCEADVPAPPFEVPVGADVARGARVTVSSTESGYAAKGLNDGIADGYPAARGSEWASDQEKAGASATLTWNDEQQVSRVALYDRPNMVDHVEGGRLVFSDGSTQAFGTLPNDGKTPTVVSFPAKTVRWVRVELTKVGPKTHSAGLAEVAAYR